MEQYQALVERFAHDIPVTKKTVTTEALAIPLGISNRHIHLSAADIETLFGKGYQLTKIKDLSQPGQYACKEVVTICGPKGVIEKVRVLGPARPETQVEILSADCFKLGVKAPIRQSGEIAETPGITIIGSQGTVLLAQGVIVAQRHIHMHPRDAEKFQVVNNQIVSLHLAGIRGGTLDNVVIRVSDAFQLECHLDTEEANAMGLNSKSKVYIN
ncbi:putative phosphotransacetylase [Enterococcus sp. PF1-24]|uniref:phosphate propanoyltransferase n=1 Tax=unclassified Enterococcus TaxID=2608891 RepID=UPI0024755D6F|nr:MULTISPECIES: phosphate propanoyltransferase [unclassified Enterococcus]MDH6364091.1 putative phosphotransacetylase [Enterococcus sp. PFB1-1]MDH6401192.1 putative phosphotransacetylase [Enterococcus sp. PF1-24]